MSKKFAAPMMALVLAACGGPAGSGDPAAPVQADAAALANAGKVTVGANGAPSIGAPGAPLADMAPSAFQVAPAAAAANQSAKFMALGFTMADGDIVAEATDESAAALNKLALLMRLKANPQLLDDDKQLAPYVRMLPKADADRIMGLLNKGKTQFDRSDAHKAFVAEWAPKFAAMTPDFPFTILEKRTAYLLQYDAARGTLGLSIDSDGTGYGGVWGRQGGARAGGMMVPLPVGRVPEWKVPEAQARDLLTKTTVTRGSAPEVTMVTRYMATGVRPAQNMTAVLDLVTISDGLNIFTDKAMSTQAGVIPLPPSALTAQAQPTAPRPFFGGEFARLMAAKLSPALADKPEFVAGTMAMRRSIETSLGGGRGEGFEGGLDFPMMVAAALRGTYDMPNDGDLARAKAWIADGAGRLGNSLRIEYGCGDTAPCVIRPVNRWLDNGVLKIEAMMAEAQGGGGSSTGGYNAGGDTYGASNHFNEATALITKLRPESKGVVSFAAGTDLLALVSLSRSTHWGAVPMPGNLTKLENIKIDFAVEASMQTLQDGTQFLLVDLEPRSVTYALTGEAVKTIDLPRAAATVAIAPGGQGKYDLAGLRLGMPLDEAMRKLPELTQAYAGSTYFTKEESGKGAPGMRHSVAWSASHGEGVWLFYDAADPRKPLTVIGRTIPMQKTGSPAEADSVVQQTVKQMADKYGAVARRGYGGMTMWAADPLVAADLAALPEITSGGGCEIQRALSVPDGGGQMAEEIKSNCGEMLIAVPGSNYMLLVAVDTAKVHALKTTEAPKPVEAQKVDL